MECYQQILKPQGFSFPKLRIHLVNDKHLCKVFIPQAAGAALQTMASAAGGGVVP